MQYRGFTLDRFQEQSIRHLQDGRSVLVAAPTGTGKTLVADWIVDEALALGKQVVYTAPIKALSNQKFRDYCRLHGEDRVGLVTGDLVIRRDAPCLVMTTEILRNMLLGGDDVHDLHAVVIDEVHFLDDRERGTVWEEVLIYLPQHVLVVALSATLPNLDAFSAWLTFVRDRPVEVVREDRRTVPLDFWVADDELGLVTVEAWEKKAKRGGRGRTSRRGSDRERSRRRQHRRGTHPIDVFKLIRRAEWLPLLYFVFSRKDAERFAAQLAFRYRAELLDRDEVARVEAILDEAGPRIGPSLDERARDMYLRGIAFHHAGLHVQLKALVEELYEQKLVKALFCTSTFALGINMPARTVAFHGLMKFDGQEVRPLTTRGFMQKAGRAGRRGMDEAGHVVLRLGVEDHAEFGPIVRGYLKQDYEPVRSSFNLSWNSIVNLLARHDEATIRHIVERSFLAWHLSNRSKEQVQRADALESGGEDGPSKRDLKEARRLRRRAERAEDRCWEEFCEKRTFLRRIGYLGDDDTFQAGAKVLQHLQIAEIFMTELVLEGALEGLEDELLFGVLCAMVSSLPRSAEIAARPTRRERELVQRLVRVRMSDAVTGAERIAKQEVTFDPDLIPLGTAWARGESLDEILFGVHSPTDMSGSLVGAFRRAKDLVGQLRDVYAEDVHRADTLRALAKRVSRDEVEVVD